MFVPSIMFEEGSLSPTLWLVQVRVKNTAVLLGWARPYCYKTLFSPVCNVVELWVET